MRNSTKTPNEVFTFAAKCVTESVFGFNMKEYYSSGAIYPSRVDNPCGTSACIAGDMAYNLDPNSLVHAASIVQTWAVGSTYYHTLTKSGQDAYDSLDHVFENPYIYGTENLADIEKGDAIALLNRLAKYETWEGVLDHLEERETGGISQSYHLQPLVLT